MRGRTLARIAATAQAFLLAGALAVPSAAAAATLAFTLGAPSLSTVAYSDFVVLRGSYTCINDGVSVCPNTSQSKSATFSIRPSGGSTFSNVGTVSTSFFFTGSAGGCPTTCSVNFSLTWKAGRALTTTMPPGVYDLGLTSTISAGQLVSLGAITVVPESTTTTYGGLTSGMGNTSLAMSATAIDQDLGQLSGTGIYFPDANLSGADLVTFELFDSTNTTSVSGPTSAFLAGGGTTTGTPTLPLPASGGTFKLRTIFVGNDFYTTSYDLDTISVTPSNTPPVITVPAGPVVAEATSPLGAHVAFTATATDAEDNPDPTPSCAPASGSAFALGDTTVSCSVTDSGGLSDSDSFTVRVVDTTDPGVSISTAEGDKGAGWYNAASNDGTAGVTIDVSTSDLVNVASLTCTDNGSDVGALSATGDSFVIGDGSHAITCTATDGAGNHASDSAAFDVDQTPPSIVASLSTDPDAATGWWNAATGAPTVTYTCGDDTSGIASCGDAHPFGEGAGQSDTGTAMDVAGNIATASVSGIDVDLTPPSITASLTPDADGATGWWNASTGAPTISFDCSDAGSGLAAPGCPDSHVFGEGAGQSWDRTVFDVAGNEATAGVTGVDVDLTAPSISASVAPAAADTGWWNLATGAPTVTYTCSDDGSGVASCSAAHPFGEGADQADTGTAVDVAGNTSTASVSNVDVDLAAPTGLAFVGGALADGASYLFGSVPAGPTGCTGSGGTSGLAGCAVSGYSTLVGVHTVTGAATDNAGNSSSIGLTYTVLPWTLAGFANPVSMTTPNLVKGGSSVNLKFEVFAGATELTSLDAVSMLLQTSVACGTFVPLALPTIALSTKGSSLRYDTSVGQYLAKWDVPSAAGTCWLVSLGTADGSSLRATFQVK
ncbi:MAG: PxKF domain-containing protein [Chloroflexi bacterium]|nr:PxKF domain-containing protein [Chloroflexota bacterium]